MDSTEPDVDRYVVHAPLYSVLIAPVEYLISGSISAVKIWTLFWGTSALILFSYFIKITLGRSSAFLGTIFFASSPLLLIYSTEVLSEIPFIVFLILILIVCERLASTEFTQKGLFLVLTVCASFIPLVREAGFAVLLALLAYLLMMKQPLKAGILFLAAATVSTLWYIRNNMVYAPPIESQTSNVSLILQHFVTAESSPLANEIALRLWTNVKAYWFDLGGMIFYPLFNTKQLQLVVSPSYAFQSFQKLMLVGKYGIVIVSVPLMIVGTFIDLRRSRTALLRMFITLFYLGVILLYPVHDIRFLFPLLPLMTYVVVVGIEWIIRETTLFPHLKRRRWMLGTLIAFILPNLVGIYEITKTNVMYRHSPESLYERLRVLPSYPLMFTKPWSLMGQWISEHVPERTVIATPAKEIAIVVGNRKVLELDHGVPLPMFETELRDNKVEYLLAPTRFQNFLAYEFLMAESRRFWFEPLYVVANLHLMRVHSRLREAGPGTPSDRVIDDSLSVTNYLMAGRKAVRAGLYPEAKSMFTAAFAADSSHPEVIYQTMLSCVFVGDTTAALKYYQRLFTLPQALSYTYTARNHIQTMRRLASAKASRIPESKAVELYKVARDYWQLGYGRRAQEIINAMLKSDSSFFVGLLWGFHFNLQMGDTIMARRYLGILENIDHSNPVVNAFDQIIALQDSLRTTSSSLENSKFHIAIGRLYKKIELNEEAIDEAELALRANPASVDAPMLMGEMFEIKRRLRMAADTYEQILKHDPQNHIASARRDSVIKRLVLQ
ncbi:MAG: glycosyltransferase family 39 protein [Ignavibacteria bacterium]|nr:glycosyltransferase family 39 protein [Ignavibacteria bacterium]